MNNYKLQKLIKHTSYGLYDKKIINHSGCHGVIHKIQISSCHNFSVYSSSKLVYDYVAS